MDFGLFFHVKGRGGQRMWNNLVPRFVFNYSENVPSLNLNLS